MDGAAVQATRFRRLTGVDQMYLAIESPGTPMHFGTLAIVDGAAEGAALLEADGHLRLPAIREALEVRTRSIPELRRVIRPAGPLAGAPLWVDDPAFRIEGHVGQVAMPGIVAPGRVSARDGARDGADEAALEERLFRFVERQMAPPLDRARPLWRVWFITGLPDRQVAVLVEIHHALADGRSAMRLVRALLTPSTPGTEPATAEPPVADPSPRWLDLVRDHVEGMAATARAVARPSTAGALVELLRSFWAGATATRGEPRSTLNALVGPRRRLVTLHLDPTTVRGVARSNHVGANDVILAIVAGGLRALLTSRGESTQGAVPRAGLAVALPPSAIGRDDGGNHFGGYVVGLPVGEPDPVARMRLVADERDRAARTQTVTGVTAVRVWTARFWPTRALMAHQRVVNLMETYLPGPRARISVFGAPVLELIPLQPLGRNVGLTFIASTYAGRLTLSVRTDPDRFADLDVLLAAMDHDWRIFEAIAPTKARGEMAGVLVPA